MRYYKCQSRALLVLINVSVEIASAAISVCLSLLKPRGKMCLCFCQTPTLPFFICPFQPELAAPGRALRLHLQFTVSQPLPRDKDFLVPDRSDDFTCKCLLTTAKNVGQNLHITLDVEIFVGEM